MSCRSAQQHDPRAAQVRIYIDADVPGLGKILAGLRGDVTYPGDTGTVIHKRQRPPCPVTGRDMLDMDWIPQIAARGWLIITRDSLISQNRSEITGVRENKAKMVALNQRDAQTKWGQLEVFMTQWRRIEALITKPGPFIWRTSSSINARTSRTSGRSRASHHRGGRPL
jgi:PIN domain-containing protein